MLSISSWLANLWLKELKLFPKILTITCSAATVVERDVETGARFLPLPSGHLLELFQLRDEWIKTRQTFTQSLQDSPTHWNADRIRDPSSFIAAVRGFWRALPAESPNLVLIKSQL